MINMLQFPASKCTECKGKQSHNKEADHKLLHSVIITHKSYPGKCEQGEIFIMRYLIPNILDSGGILEADLILNLQFNLAKSLC
jgi:hypothetical protein